jgi:hypothetical protein
VKRAFESPDDPASWKIAIEERPIEGLQTIAEWFSGYRICESTGDLIPNTNWRLRTLSDSIRARYPELVNLSP